VNPFGMHFSMIKSSDLVRVDHAGHVVEGDRAVNGAAVAIHCAVHAARPDVVAAAHAHGPYGKTLSSLDMTIEPLTQDACAFYDDVGTYTDYRGVVLSSEEGERIGRALGPHKAVILRNHGMLTVGESVESAGLVVPHPRAHQPVAADGLQRCGRPGHPADPDRPGRGGGHPRPGRLRAGRLVPVPADLGAHQPRQPRHLRLMGCNVTRSGYEVTAIGGFSHPL
jgi:hypothetical protein